MERLRREKKMFSVNQLTVYHMAMETYNVLVNNSSEILRERMVRKSNEHYSLRSEERGDLQLPVKPKNNCMRFSYIGGKIWNMVSFQFLMDISNFFENFSNMRDL